LKIQVKQSGGYAGISVELADLDTATLAPATARRLEQLVLDAGFFQLSTELPAPSDAIGADRLQYVVTVEDGGRRHTVTVADSTPEVERLRGLIAAAQGR